MFNKTIFSLMAVIALASCSSNEEAVLVSDGSAMNDIDNEGGYQNSYDYGYLDPNIDEDELRNIEDGSQEQLVALAGDRVFFRFNSSDIDSTSSETLSRQARWLVDHDYVTITVEGHCDERGTREYNLALGEKRANSIKNFLINEGVSANRIYTISYGKERPAYQGSSEAAWSKNRRGATVVN